jgi:hypothetical protein
LIKITNIAFFLTILAVGGLYFTPNSAVQVVDICNCKGYDGPGGPAYSGPGGPAYAGPGGPCYAGAVTFSICENIFRPLCSIFR